MANLNLEIDGKAIAVPQGSTVMDAANQVGAYVPHFCYHKKLSIAANCRMCLVQVEKAPKPLPACATPVTEGMKVSTTSDYAKNAQKSVMEFLLINHPLDCPICDQGGECQLQDLAVGYGKSGSRYQEEKRIVFHKNIGPLVSMEEMSRCIHCTRCVRFGQEVAGVMELGMGGRGEHSEIQSFVGRTVDSELSGNMIDVCPVGALTSKPFRYSARTWELQRRKSVSPHDGLGANITVQVKQNKVMRVLPFENEAINECWISDRDRFSYEGLNSDDRLTTPMVKQGGVWQTATWQQAMDYAAHALADVKNTSGADSIAMLASPTATIEELFLLKKLANAIGTKRFDARPRVSDAALDAGRGGVPYLGMKIAEINALDRMLIVGSSLRSEQPVLAARIRQIARKACKVSFVNPVDDDPLMPVVAKAIVRPSAIAATINAIASNVEQRKAGAAAANTNVGDEIAASLASGKNVGIFIGELALNSTSAAAIELAVQKLADTCGAKWGRFAAHGNTVGAYIVGALGETAPQVCAKPPKAAILWGIEPELDTAAGSDLIHALKGAASVIACVTHKSAAQDYADVLLPIAPFTETSGTFVNCEGTAQSVQATVRPLGEARPGWKVLRVLSELLGAKDVAFDSSEAVRDAALPQGWESRLGNSANAMAKSAPAGAIERIADTPIYQSDTIVRRAVSLQKAGLSKIPAAQIASDLAQIAGISGAGRVRLVQSGVAGQGVCIVDAVVNASLPLGTMRIPAAQNSTSALGSHTATITVERAQ
jgi:NADH-quinone oxidoreductase subunit G